MPSEDPTQARRHARQREIFAAVYELLSEKGYRGTSILAVARRANASNETLYKWFGNKQGMLAAMIADNAREAAERIAAALHEQASLRETLSDFGPALLSLVVGERSVALNRAAAADVADGGVLGALIDKHGRFEVKRQLTVAVERAIDRGELVRQDPVSFVEIYLGTLVGDLQLRRVIGTAQPLSSREIAKRAELALDAVFRTR